LTVAAAFLTPAKADDVAKARAACQHELAKWVEDNPSFPRLPDDIPLDLRWLLAR
jgi:hypothetical protein